MMSRPETSETGLPYPRWLEVTIVVGFWVTYFLLRVAWDVLNRSYPIQSVLFPIVGWGTFCFLYLLLTFLLFEACRRIQVRTLGWAGAITGHLALMLLVTIASEVVIEWSQHFILTGLQLPVPGSGPRTFAGVVQNLTFIEEVKAYALILVAGLARDFFLRYTSKQAQAHELEQRAQRLETQLASARLDALRMQINPHFLFNTLHVINTMAGSNPDGVRQATRRLSGLLRYALNTADEQEVSVTRELQFLRGYLQIQKLRLQEQLQVEISVAAEARDALVPNLLLQPLAENAVKHGVQAIKGRGEIRVDVRREAESLLLRIDDNGPGPTRSARKEDGVGLENIRDRLAHLYGEQGTLTLGTSDLGGCRAEVKVPYHTGRDPHFEAVSEKSTSPSPA